MNRLIDIDPQIQQESEPEGYKFGYYMFDTLPVLEVSNIETTQNILKSWSILWNSTLVLQ